MQIFVHNPHNRSFYDPNDLQQQQSKSNRDSTNDGIRLAQHSSATIAADLNFLNINQTITCLAAGSISSISLKDTLNDNDIAPHSSSVVITSNKETLINSAGSGRKISLKSKNLQQTNKNNDILIVGTKTSIHAYDILHNSDLYYKEVSLKNGHKLFIIDENNI